MEATHCQQIITLGRIQIYQRFDRQVIKFSVRPPELWHISDSVGYFYKWFVYVLKQLSGESLYEELTQDWNKTI